MSWSEIDDNDSTVLPAHVPIHLEMICELVGSSSLYLPITFFPLSARTGTASLSITPYIDLVEEVIHFHYCIIYLFRLR